MFTIPKPIDTAITVVTKYKPIVRPPIFESFEISFKSETPFINEAKIKGTAISFKRLIKIVPKGFIQSVIIWLPNSKFAIINANPTPKNIPNIICQCNASFFIV